MRTHVTLADKQAPVPAAGSLRPVRGGQAPPRSGQAGTRADFAGIGALGGALIPAALNLPDKAAR